MLINELAQWAVLLFIAIFVLGLTRQLGNFLVPKREQMANSLGPALGASLPLSLLDAGARAHVNHLMRDRQTDWGVVLIVSEDCPSCDTVLDRLGEQRPSIRGPIVALSRRSGSAHEDRLRGLTDLVVVGGAALKAEGLTATPFAMVIDESFRVRHKALATDVADTLAAWSGTHNGHGGVNGGGGSVREKMPV
jgi:hypothetical protein